MSDRDALLAAIIANPDDDTPRLIYADWLDENLPEKASSPAAGPSARAEYIRVQCRLARLPFDDPDYPELIEREQDLADWLKAHAPDEDPDLTAEFDWFGNFDWSHDKRYSRGFPEEFEFTEYDDDPQSNINTITENLPEVFEQTTLRTLRLENPYGSEVAGVLAHPAASGLRGLILSDIDDDNDAEAVAAVASSKRLANLRRLELDIAVSDESLKLLAKAPHLGSLESLAFGYGLLTGLAPLGAAKWFRNLRALRVWLPDRNALKDLAALPPMPNVVSLILSGVAPAAAAVRKFAASDSFPRLAHLDFDGTTLTPELVAALAVAEWPLRHLKLSRLPVQKAGAAALARAAFAGSLRVLELRDCGITAGGVQALANSERLAGLRHLDLSENPIGPGGLAAIARSKCLRGLRKLSLNNCNHAKAPIAAAVLAEFLAAVEMPELRHLDLAFLPVGVRGAAALGERETFANLTRASLTACGLREKGARAVVESPNLANLAVLEMVNNNAGKGLAKLADRKVLPRLAQANVCNNRIPKSILARLAKRPGVQV